MARAREGWISGVKLVVLADGTPGTAYHCSHGNHDLTSGYGASICQIVRNAAIDPRIERIAVSAAHEGFDGLFDCITTLPGRGVIELVDARKGDAAASIAAAAHGWQGPVLVVGAGCDALGASDVDAIIERLSVADVVFARTVSRTVTPRRRDRTCCALSGPDVMPMLETETSGGQHGKLRRLLLRRLFNALFIRCGGGNSRFAASLAALLGLHAIHMPLPSSFTG